MGAFRAAVVFQPSPLVVFAFSPSPHYSIKAKLGAVVEDAYLKQLISSLSATQAIFPSAAGKELPLFKLAVAVVELVLHTLLDEASN